MVTTDYKLTISKTGHTNVEVLLIDPKCVKHQWDKLLIQVPKPGMKASNPSNHLIDLRRLKETITVQGILLDEADSTALSKKNNLRGMLQTSGTMTITWDTNDWNQPYTVNVIKAEIAESAGNLGDENDTKFYDTRLQFATGTHKGV